MRIISGKFKGLKLFSPKNNLIRPTSDRGKETIFNTLTSILFIEEKSFSKMRVLDCFCGSGALGIECISRGSENVYFIDSSEVAIDLTKKNCSLLDENKNLNFLKLDLTNFEIDLINADLFFLDPPYDEVDIEKVLGLLKINRSINEKSIGIIEVPFKKEIVIPEGFKKITVKKVSSSNFLFLKKI
tara:strand:+ start:377 stop:934 length:558 start_codon:yes stop_codon:yes gene_type:complete